MESIARMSNPYQLGRVESNDTAVGSGIFNNPKYEFGDATTGTRTTGNDFNLQLTKDNYSHDNSVNNDLTGNTITSEAGAGATKGSGTAVMTAFEDYLDLDLEAMQLQQHLQQQQQQLQFQQMQLHLQQQQQQQQQEVLPMLPKRDSSRRLSISDYNVDNAGYYEYEYFGKPSFQMGDSCSSSNTNDYDDRTDLNINEKSNDVMNEPFTDLDFKLSAGSTTAATNNDNLININNANFLQDEAIMMSDEDWGTPSDETAVQMGTNNDLFGFFPQSQSLEVPMAEDYNLDVDVDAPLIEPQQPPKKKVKDYFKLNFFTNSNNSNNNNHNNNNSNCNNSNGNGGSTDLVVGDEPVFKKRYFWNRNPMKRRARQDDLLEVEEDHTLVNPSQLVTGSNEYDDDDSHTVSEPITQFAVFDNLQDKALPTTMIDPTQTPITAVDHVEPMAPIAETTTAAAAADGNTNNINSTATSSPPPLVRKRLGSMPKTRGRKPSPILDATKHFGCEYCDRRFKRQEHLKRHVRSLHMCEKPFGCHICGKKFSRSDNLNQHIKTHTHQ
ncbi:hypothetical protein ZYGR_0BB00450 [Zygosaccharomyces rouxii]|uniref:C2H2-type domain-containing protein n=1 Tax=Zygosaccharomyces rouxii TaxID=4956 RepID=A0A1Q3AKK0_ZYGRO|nr:hypothetical protein ZYGR_0BB00450 [Zygosaccharomyces rouxii]